MNFSYNWLRELVEGLDASPSELTGLITIKTAECEGVHDFAPHLSAVCAARVESVEPIEGSKNVKAVVDTGRYGRKTVVCGAPNCRPGVVTAYVPSGTTLGNKEIRKATIGGVESDGMLASGAELGINGESAGILELQGLEPGAPLGAEPDSIIEVDNKSLTHRPDLWGHHGMAREVSAITRRALKDPVDLSILPTGDGSINVRIEDYEMCPRYSALVLENVTVGPSPLWLQARLEAVGLNSISNVVDVTNWVMAEIAQPMHAFDADKLHGGIVVRRAGAGERIVALNHEEYELQSSNLVIADEESAIAVAGVIGGLYSAIGPETKRIVLESANFHPGSVRKTSVNLKLRTDASMRFEKSQDPENTVRGLARAVQLLQMVSPGIRVVGGVVDVRRKDASTTTRPVVLPLEWLDRKIGRHVDPAEVRQILESLQFGVTEPEPGVLSVVVPSWRATKDISIKDDLVEEIGRMIGYASIPPQPPLVPTKVPPANPARAYHHDLRAALSAIGFDEVYNYSFVNEKTIDRFGLNFEEHVRVLNPIASDQTHLRTSLVPGIQKNIEDNARYFEEFRLYEIGVEIRKKDVASDLPVEAFHLCAASYRREGDAEALFELKSLAEELAPGVVVKPSVEPQVYEHPARVADLILEGRPVGRLFELHPAFCERGRAAILNLNLDLLLEMRRAAVKYRPLRRFPSSSFDLSVVAPARALSGDIEALLRQHAGSELESMEWVREYSGPPLAEGTKSVSYRLTVGAQDRTLSSDDLTAIRQRIIEGMRGAGYELRV